MNPGRFTARPLTTFGGVEPVNVTCWHQAADVSAERAPHISPHRVLNIGAPPLTLPQHDVLRRWPRCRRLSPGGVMSQVISVLCLVAAGLGRQQEDEQEDEHERADLPAQGQLGGVGEAQPTPSTLAEVWLASCAKNSTRRRPLRRRRPAAGRSRATRRPSRRHVLALWPGRSRSAAGTVAPMPSPPAASGASSCQAWMPAPASWMVQARAAIPAASSDPAVRGRRPSRAASLAAIPAASDPSGCWGCG